MSLAYFYFYFIFFKLPGLAVRARSKTRVNCCRLDARADQVTASPPSLEMSCPVFYLDPSRNLGQRREGFKRDSSEQ